MDFGVGPTRVDINLKIATVERTMEAEEAATKDQAAEEPGILYNVRCHMPNKTTFAEKVQVAAEAAEPATVVDSEKKDVNDGDRGGSSYSKSTDSEDLVEEVSEKTDTSAVEVLGGVQLYELIDEDQGCFTNMVTRLTSRA